MIRDILILHMNDQTAREKILDKSQLEGKIPSLESVVALLKNYEARKEQ